MAYNSVDIGGFRFEGAAGDDIVFIGGVLQGLTGWRGLPGARGDSDPVPSGNGSFDRVRFFREGRSMELRGGIVAETPAAASALLTQLETICSSGPVQMRVEGDDGDWVRNVEVVNLIPGDRWIDSRFSVTLDLFAADPIRYRADEQFGPVGPEQRVGGLELPEALPWHFGDYVKSVLLVENSGTVPALPVVVIEGSATEIVAHCGGRKLSLGSFSGQLVLDSRMRRAWLNGVDVTADLGDRSWHSIAPGDTASLWFQGVGVDESTRMFVRVKIGAW